MSRRFTVVVVLATLLVAGVASYYASDRPDGLEHVAAETGFLDSAEDSPVADGPLADYRTEGIESSRVSGGVAGVTGVVLVLVVASGLAWLVRRRPSEGTQTETSRETSTR